MLDAMFLRELAENVRRYAVRVEEIRIRIPKSYNGELNEILQECILEASKGNMELHYNRKMSEDATIAELIRLGFKLSRTSISNHYMMSW